MEGSRIAVPPRDRPATNKQEKRDAGSPAQADDVRPVRRRKHDSFCVFSGSRDSNVSSAASIGGLGVNKGMCTRRAGSEHCDKK
jgi:hypothetical protein